MEKPKFDFTIKNVKASIVNYSFGLFLLSFSLLLISLLCLLSNTQRLNKKKQFSVFIYLTLLFALLLIVIFYYSGRTSWGSQGIYLNASLMRHSLVLIALGLPILSNLILSNKDKNMKILSVFIVILLLFLSSAEITYNTKEGILHNREEYLEHVNFYNNVSEHVGDDAIVIVEYMDRAIFPLRKTLTASFLSKESMRKNLNPDNPSPWSVVPTKERFIEIISFLINEENELYIVRPSRFNISNKDLLEKELIMVKISKEEGRWDLYKIEKKKDG